MSKPEDISMTLALLAGPVLTCGRVKGRQLHFLRKLRALCVSAVKIYSQFFYPELTLNTWCLL